MDEHAGVVIVVDRALAVASATKAGERDGLTGERASIEGGRAEEVMAGGAGDVFVARQHGGGLEGEDGGDSQSKGGEVGEHD